MCGIVGFWAGSAGRDDPLAVLERMTTAIIHRGPDDSGHWFDPVTGLGLGQRRLSILDLSSTGHQPMESASGRYQIVFNGEIYNFADLRDELERLGRSFRGTSDTEVLLGMIEQYGLEVALQRSVGMFALALWDRGRRELSLARDRFGEKPLYYGRAGRTLVFGSELKALRAHPDWEGQIDLGALTLLLRHNYIPGPHSIYRGVRKVGPGTIVRFGSAAASGEMVVYWSAKEWAERGLATPFAGDEAAALEQLEQLLRGTVRQQMVADVPLGAFLSGGIDSSLVVAMMQAESSRPVQTFTIGFHEATYNEAEHAKKVAAHLGTDHTELYVTPRETMDVVPKIPTLYDEPFADSSQIPTFLVAQMARRRVTVALSGDGGDEVFGGYWRYVLGERWWRRIVKVPRSVRETVAGGLRGVSPAAWDAMFQVAHAVVPERYRIKLPGDRIHKLAGIMTSRSSEALYHDLITHWPEPASVVVGGREPETVFTDSGCWANLPGSVSRMMYLDTVGYLPDDILVKVDRASMGVSLETRAPFLDHRLFEFAWTLPIEYKIRGGAGKWLLRQLLAKHLPATLFERPKMGFGVPIERWLRGPLKEWAGDLLAPDRLRREGFLDPEPIQRSWRQHQAGSRNSHHLLWAPLMFEAWLAEQTPGRIAA